MPDPTTIAIFKELNEPTSISDIAGILGLSHSTISTAVSSLIQEGLAKRQTSGKMPWFILSGIVSLHIYWRAGLICGIFKSC